MTTSIPAPYQRAPIEEVDGIPVFSTADRYVDNYVRIAADHLQAMQPGNDNPFIESELWLQLENSTRALVRKHVADGARVLDVGVGMGRVLGPLDTLQRHGIDISLDYLRVARDNGFEVAFAKIEDMPYVDGCFDAVIACDVLEHVIDLHACCTQMVRVLRPGGALIVRVPYLDDLDAYLNDALPYEFIHLRNFDVAGLRLLFGKIHGLEFVERRFVAPYLKGHPRMKLRLLDADSPVHALVAGIEDPKHPLALLKRAAAVKADEYMNWLYDLRDRHPELYDQVAQALVHPLEVNVVFRKKSPVAT